MTNYVARLHNVLEYIDSHLDENPNLEAISRFANLSKYHFHRQFSTHYGIGIREYIKQQRLKRAAYQLAFRSESNVTDVAFDCGYESPEAFSRAFKSVFGQSPTVFRKAPDWTLWNNMQKPLASLRNKIMIEKPLKPEVRVVDFPQTPVAAMEHRGTSETKGSTIRKFIVWRKANGLSPDKSRTFNLIYNDHTATESGEFNFDVCVSVNRKVDENASGIINKIIPAGRCAVARHIGSDDTIDNTIIYLYTEWLEQNDEEIRDFPLFFERINFFPDVPEHETITDVYLPLI